MISKFFKSNSRFLQRYYTISQTFEDHVINMKKCMGKAGFVRKPIEAKYFNEISEQIFQRNKIAWKKLCEDYKDRGSFIEDLDNERIQVNVKGRGLFEMWVDREKQIINFFSPVSGTHRYWFEKNNEVWLSETDLHNMMERVARELMAIGPMKR